MEGSGTVIIETRQAHPEEISRLGLSEDVDFARITVTDHGCGMDAHTMEMMFEPMFTLKKAGGTGLGLAVVQQIVNKHGGTISVDSEPEGGTAFHLFFPLCDPPPESAERPGLSGRRNVRRLLLVEDDPNVGAGLAAVLEMEGIEVRIVTHGLAAPAEVESFRPDAVVIDRGLPDIDGIEVSRMLAARWPNLPMVFSTGHGGRDDLEELLQKPNVGYLLKPYDVDTLLDLLDRVSATPER
jgi:Response regulator containing CheY-like receiver, AAA-type ATPase, and DNA-binding domains